MSWFFGEVRRYRTNGVMMEPEAVRDRFDADILRQYQQSFQH